MGVARTTRPPTAAPGVRRALAEWARNIQEPPKGDPREIDKYIRGRDGSAWTWTDPYVRDGQLPWCGMYAGWALRLKPVIRTYFMPGCRRLMKGHGTKGHWTAGTGKGLAPGSRLVRDLASARPGDIGIFGDGTDPEGQHIGIIVARDGTRGVFTVEGNSFGDLPDGTKGQGVVRNWRPLRGHQKRPGDYYLMHLIRPVPSDFEGA